ncbi:hypothetical protein EMCRGX_G009975 [Ephydatia muelleri]
MTSIEADDDCYHILFDAWYLDDGVITGDRQSGDVVARHNYLIDIFADFCCRVHLPVKVKVGYGLGRDHVNSCPKNVLVQGWDRGKSVAFDITVTFSSLLSPSVKLVWRLGQQHLQLNPGSMLPTMLSARSWGGHAFHLPSRHTAIGGKEVLSRLASLLAISQASSKSKMNLRPSQFILSEISG